MSAWSNPRADDERTLGFDEEWEDIPTAQLETVEDKTLDIEPPSHTDREAPNLGRPQPAHDTNVPVLSDTHHRAPPPPPQSIEAPVREPATSAPPEMTTGTVLCGRYLLGRLLGTGGSSLIFEAEDRLRVGPNDGARLAIKVLREDKRENPHALTRLKREFRQMQRLDHPGIARVFELGCDDGVWFMTMELVEGCTINQWLKTHPGRAEALKLIGACSDALVHAHERGVVHGDLKPSNVIVLPNGGVKLVDFGSAAERDAVTGAIDRERSFAATPPYASPQVLAGEVADPRDDVFSLACLTYAVLTHGEHPFARKSSLEAQQQQLRPAYAREIHPREFDAIVQGLAWAREDRPASVREFLHALLASDLRAPTRDSASATIDVARPAPAATNNPVDPTPPIKPTPQKIQTKEPAAEITHPIAAQPPHRPASTVPMTAAAGALAKSKSYVSDLVASLQVRSPTAATETTQSLTPREKHEPRSWKRVTFVALLVAAMALVVYRLEVTEEAAMPVQDVSAPIATPPPPEPIATTESSASPTLPASSTTEQESAAVVEKPAPPPSALGEVSFTTRTLQVGPNQTMAALTIQRSKSTRGRARVAWTIEGGTAQPDVDYQVGDSRIVEFLDGQSVRSLFIPLIPQGNSEQARLSKTFTVKLQQTSGGPALGEIKQVHVTIVGNVAGSAAESVAATSTPSRVVEDSNPQ